jgi:hypothetical protein
VIAEFEKKYAGRANFREERVPAYQLPDPLLCADGTRVDSVETWERKRRPETLALVQSSIYAPAGPGGVTVFETLSVNRAAMDGAATLKHELITSSQGGNRTRRGVAVRAQRSIRARRCFVFINNAPPVVDLTREKRTSSGRRGGSCWRGYAGVDLPPSDVDPDKDAPRPAPPASAASRLARHPGKEPMVERTPAWAGRHRVMDYTWQPTPATPEGAVIGPLARRQSGVARRRAGLPRFGLVICE